MARFFIKATNATTTLTRASTTTTLRNAAVAIRDYFKAGGTGDIGATDCYVQWNGTTFEIVIERDDMAAVSSDLATFKSNVRTGLLAVQLSGQAFITALSVDDITVLEQGSVAATAGSSWAPSHASTAAPTANNDSADSAELGKTFGVGSWWMQTTTGRAWILRDATPTEADWVPAEGRDAWTVDTKLGTDSGRQGYSAAGWSAGANGSYTDQATYTAITGNAHSRYLSRSMPGAVTESAEFELRLRMRAEPGASSNADCGLYMDWGAAGKGLYLRFQGDGVVALQYINAGGYWTQWDWVGTGHWTDGSDVVLTLRRRVPTGDTSGGFLEAWLGDTMIGILRWSSLYASVNIGAIQWGHSDTTSAASQDIRLHRFALRAGINQMAVPVALAAENGWT